MKRIASVSLALGLVAILTAGATSAWAADCGGVVVCACGNTVTSDYTFSANLTCVGNGLTVAAGVSVDLATFRLTGTNKAGVGLLLQGAGGSIDGGRVENFGSS